MAWRFLHRLVGLAENEGGKVSNHSGIDLVDVKRYLAEFKKESDRINVLIDEAKTIGM